MKSDYPFTIFAPHLLQKLAFRLSWLIHGAPCQHVMVVAVLKKPDKGFFQNAAIYLYIALGVVAAAAVIWLVVRFFPFRFRLEKRQ